MMTPTPWDDRSADPHDFEPDDHDDDDHEYPDADLDDEESTDTIPCPACGADVYEDADRCPVCGEYLMADTTVWSDKPFWWIAIGILGIIALIAALILGI